MYMWVRWTKKYRSWLPYFCLHLDYGTEKINMDDFDEWVFLWSSIVGRKMLSSNFCFLILSALDHHHISGEACQGENLRKKSFHLSFRQYGSHKYSTFETNHTIKVLHLEPQGQKKQNIIKEKNKLLNWRILRARDNRDKNLQGVMQ